MSTLYAESSAILRWLLGTSEAPVIRKLLSGARLVVSTALTAVEVARTLRRLTAGGSISADAREAAWVRYCVAAGHWNLVGVTDQILTRAGEAFPLEPVRTLDAVHLATAALYHREVEPLAMLSVDARVRANAEAMGIEVLPVNQTVGDSPP